MSMTLIETKTLGTAATSITFTSIPQDSTDLLLVLSGRSDRALVNDYVAIKFNGSTSNFSMRLLRGDGSAAASGTDVSYGAPRIAGEIPSAGSTSNTFGNLAIYIPNYAGSTAKSFSVDAITENNGTSAFQEIIAALWNDTATITSITLEPVAGGTNNFIIGTMVSLYKITKGSSGGVVVS